MLLIFDIKFKTFVRTIKLSGLSRIMVSAKTIVAWFCMAYNKLHFVIKIWKFSSKMLGKFLSNILEKRKVSWNSELQQNSAFLPSDYFNGSQMNLRPETPSFNTVFVLEITYGLNWRNYSKLKFNFPEIT